MTTNKEIIEPVLNNENESCWLTRTYKKISTGDTDRPIKDVLKENKSLEEKPIFELQPEGLWQCQKCGTIIGSIPDPPIECYENQGGCGRTSSFKPVTKTINPDLWKLPIWTDINPDMNKAYNKTIDVIKKVLVLPEEIWYKILTLWIFSTWKTGYWNTVGFPIFRGEYNTGKTTALDVICNLGYRMIHSAGTTFPAMVRATHFHHAGLCVDEASARLDPRTETGREMLNFVKPSYRKGSVYTVADKEDQEKVICYNNFGFKAFAGERDFNPSLLSRAFDIIMQEDYPQVPSIQYVQDDLNKIQTHLLNYRYKTDNPPDLGMDFCLQGRLRETYESIIATGMHIGIDVQDIIEHAKSIKQERENDLLGTVEYDVLTAIYTLSCHDVQSKLTEQIDAPEYVLYTDIFKEIYPNHEDFDKDERKRKGARIGYVIKNLHLKNKRMGSGKALILNDKKNMRRLDYLYKKYKVGCIPDV